MTEISTTVERPVFYEPGFYSFYSRNVEVMNPENELATSQTIQSEIWTDHKIDDLDTILQNFLYEVSDPLDLRNTMKFDIAPEYYTRYFEDQE